MADDMVMRSIYLRPNEDAELKQLALSFQLTKSDLIRAAISLKLADWRGDNSGDRIKTDVEAGLREVVVKRRSSTTPVKGTALRKIGTTKKAASKAGGRNAAGPKAVAAPA